MPVQLGDTPQADFHQPLRLMMDCHRRIERFLDVLIRVLDARSDQPLDDEQRRALETALNYFRSAGPQHNQDEEQSLFPRMRASSDPAVARALARVEELERDHETARHAHDRVDELGRQWLAEGRITPPAAAEMHELLTRLRSHYQQHIRTEDEDIFPLASRVLTDHDLAEIGREMKHRRQEKPGRAGSRCAARRRGMER